MRYCHQVEGEESEGQNKIKMKAITQIKEICGGLATVKKVRGEASAIISFHKNWGHGKLGGDKSQGTLGKLAAAGFAVESGHYGNEYIVKLA